MELSFAEYADKNRVKNTKMELHLAVVVIPVMLFTFNIGSYLAEISMDTARSSVHENLIALAIKFLNFFIAKLFSVSISCPIGNCIIIYVTSVLGGLDSISLVSTILMPENICIPLFKDIEERRRHS